jgi:hypothetical protein
MSTTRLGWREFRERLLDYVALPSSRRREHVFRGQADERWPLAASLDRWRKFSCDTDRDSANRDLVESFRREMILSDLPGTVNVSDPRLLELLARHHGLPSPLLDWTSSPYMAAFFAFDEMKTDQRAPQAVSVWVLDRAQVRQIDGIDFIDAPELLRFNPRALRQHGVFSRISTIRQTVEALLSPGLTRFDIDAADARLALADLDAMRINAANLYGDLDGVSKTVLSRFG